MNIILKLFFLFRPFFLALFLVSFLSLEIDFLIPNSGISGIYYGQWKPGIEIYEYNYLYQPSYSRNVTIKDNIIRDSYGEGIRINYCDECVIIKNNITNTLNMSIYIYSSSDSIVDKNLIRVTSNLYNSADGRACGIGMTPNYDEIIDNITITNNIIIGARVGIFFFPDCSRGGYDKIKIFHNTLWNISQTPVRFDDTINVPKECEMKNNFIYVNEAKEFESKSSWSFGYNLYYNTYDVPEIYYDTTSKAAKQLNISTILLTGDNQNTANYFAQKIILLN